MLYIHTHVQLVHADLLVQFRYIYMHIFLYFVHVKTVVGLGLVKLHVKSRSDSNMCAYSLYYDLHMYIIMYA